MGQFSDDGHWWWDGTNWIATSQMAVPQLPPTEFELSGKVTAARERMRPAGWLATANGCSVQPITAITGIALLNILQPTLRDYRAWRLEQLALATAYVLGPGEPIVAAEPASGTSGGQDQILAVVVTSEHVVVFRFDEAQPRWIMLAARPGDVEMQIQSVAMGLLYRAIVVTSRTARIPIRGWPGVFKPEPVLDAWRRAVAAAAPAT